MHCQVTLRREAGAVLARCADYPRCEGRGASESEALERLRAAIVFELEICPCDVTTEPGLELEVTGRT